MKEHDMVEVKLGSLAIDCPNPLELATFYSRLLGLEMNGEDAILTPEGREIWFQKVDDYQAPTWPTQERGQQMHFDFMVRDIEEAQAYAIELGAKLVDDGQESFHVLLDPAGHPFCLCKQRDE
jgi:catechol 2,3-dioxygenase-like lactoylglutathione lyase family enzyme